ncbi:MAG TPA: zinc ribbon domain-containing protein [Chloroflexi bacterium]|jgi:hypothetical protein|nr:zinc ribbon domain-containing protein [Chloroflexota bacterium]
MIVCPACEHRNPEGRDTCENCGASLEHFVYRACPNCGALNAAQDVFCRRCLTELRAAPPSPSAPEPGALEEEAVPGPEPVTPEIEEPGPPVEPEAAPEQAPVWEPEAALPEEEIGEPPLPEDENIFEEIGGPLDGLEEVLSVGPAMSGASISRPMDVTPPTEVDREDAQLFHEIASSPAPLHEPMQVIIPRRTMVMPWGLRLFLYLLVLMAALVPLFTGGTSPWSGLDATTEPAAMVSELPEGSVALISFEYDASYAGEMNPAVYGIVRDLAERGVRVVAMSTRFGGNALAEQILRRVSADLPEYTYGEDYLILGYLPGQEAGLYTLGQNLRNAYKVDHMQQVPLDEHPLMQELMTVGDFDRVLLLADDGQIVRQWVEQVQSRTPIMVDVLTTTRIQPLLIPYRQSGQLHSLMAAGRMHVVPASSDGYAALILVMAVTALTANLFIRSGRDG